MTFIAERDSQWIGLATGIPHEADDPERSGPVLVGMFVDPAERGHGLGVTLVEAIAAWARARGAACLYLWVTSTNNHAIALYSRCGFRPTGETRPVAHAPSVAELRMVRDLQ